MIDFTLSPSEIQELRNWHKSTRDKRYAYRINAIILLGQGYTPLEVALVLLLEERSVRRFWEVYHEKGVDGLLILKHKGKKPALTVQQDQALEAYLSNNLCNTAKEVVAYVEEKYEKTFTPESMVKKLHKLGFSYKKAKLVPSKANAEEQKQFVQSYKSLRQSLKNDEKIYFMDSVHPTHNTVSSYGWIKKGTEYCVKSNTGRKRININGVYSPIDNEIITREDERINAQSTITLLSSIEEKHPELTKIYVIRDNAKYYTCELVKNYLKTSRVEMVALPTYSPNLNLIERLWKFFKKKTLIKYREKFADFREDVQRFFNVDVLGYKKELSTLMSERFRIVDT
jgi:transposase